MYKKLTIPELPPNQIPFAKYRTKDYLNVVVKTENELIFYLWDEVSLNYSQILYFPLIKY